MEVEKDWRLSEQEVRHGGAGVVAAGDFQRASIADPQRAAGICAGED
jgi:hypothetical protein